MTSTGSTHGTHDAGRKDDPARGAGARFWAGGLATAIVAALVAVAGRLVAEGLLGVDLLPAGQQGVLAWSEGVSYATGAAALALICTAIAHLLVLSVPRPLAFFEWIVALIGLVLAAAPFAADAPLDSRIATAVVAAVVVIAVGSLLSGLLMIFQRQVGTRSPHTSRTATT